LALLLKPAIIVSDNMPYSYVPQAAEQDHLVYKAEAQAPLRNYYLMDFSIYLGALLMLCRHQQGRITNP